MMPKKLSLPEQHSTHLWHCTMLDLVVLFLMPLDSVSTVIEVAVPVCIVLQSDMT